jgi:Xaa-Pro aminopeptidase
MTRPAIPTAALAFAMLFFLAPPAPAQDAPLFRADFPPDEFRTRRAAIYHAIGPSGVALVQGAPSPEGYRRFRQTNEFYYLCGVETPGAYLLLDGTSRRTRLYLPHRNAAREASEGRLLSAEDAEEVRRLTGVEDVHGAELLSDHLARFAWGDRIRALHLPLRPAEGVATSRDLAVRAASDVANDPWDGRPTREARFADALRGRFPHFRIEDLSPALDQLRMVKSPREIELIRRATRLSGLALMEAMRSTEPGLFEHELDGLSKFIFFRNGAHAEAYYSLIASGPNAWFPHYHRGARRLEAGELLLMDHAPDFGYYSSDVTRQWPVDGSFDGWERDLYGFYLATYEAFLSAIRPGDAREILREVAGEWERIVAGWPFTQDSYRTAGQAFVRSFREQVEAGLDSLGHGVGMAVHDVGAADGSLTEGMVFTIEPQFRVPEGQIYIRLEDVVVITSDGAEVLSDFVPRRIDEIEALMAEEGLLQRYPRAEWR